MGISKYIEAKTLDDLLNETFNFLLENPANIDTSRGRITHEIIGSLLCLTNPKARLSRTETRGKAFSALGELCWYLAKSNELSFIQHYITGYAKDAVNGKIHGGYGPRLFNMHGKYDQIENIINLLKKRPTSRKAVIQLYDAADLGNDHPEFPCTCFMQFFIRNNQLHMYVSMRSNDAYLGLPHDIFAFTMLQEIVACSLDLEIGIYSHAVGSLHLYEGNLPQIHQYLKEGWQPTVDVSMPAMPIENPWPFIKTFLETEQMIRTAKEIDFSKLELNEYWLDLIYLLQTHAFFKFGKSEEIDEIQKQIKHPVYKIYIGKKIKGSKPEEVKE